MRILLSILSPFLLMSLTLPGQSSSSPLDVGPMRVNWVYEEEDILFTVSSPGNGWVILGTNVKNDIVGATLYMGGVDDRTEQSYFSERRTVSMGSHRAKVDLGDPERAHNVTAAVSVSGTTLSFRVRVKPTREVEHDLRPGSSVWLILAYSVSDDLGHHSRFRRHVEVTL